jgi:tetratricopeptide (TPR) repeat protein
VSYFEQALAALGHRPESRETLERAIDLRLDLRASLSPLGEFETIFARLREAEGLARTLADQRRLGQTFVYMCNNLYLAGRATEALAFGQDAQALGESLGDAPLLVTGNIYFGAACLGTGDYRRAEALLLTVLQLLEGDPNRDRLGLAGFPAVVARSYLAWVLADQGKFEEGTVHGQEGLRLAETLEHPYSLAFGCWALAYLQIKRGELGHAAPLLERGQALCREWNLKHLSVAHTGILGHARALSGRVAEGISALEDALSAMEAMGFGVHQLTVLTHLGEAYVLADRLEDALAVATRALTLARDRGHRNDEARALRLLGDVTARRESPEDAERLYRDALALAEALGMRPLVAHCHLGLATLHRRTGARAPAQEHLTCATTLYREMDMPSWIERADAEASALDVHP